jgi:Carboxypeptidase regulatory-like domain
MFGYPLRKHLRRALKHSMVWTAQVVLLGAYTAHAQTSQVSGQVTDASKAAVPDAELTLTRVETGYSRQQHSTSDGYYSFPLLVAGHFDLKIEKQGFETQEQKGIIVETGSVSTVNVTLAVGAIAQTVSVDATVPLLQSETSAVNDVVENQTIVNMPLIDRRSSQLQRLSGFVVGNGTGSNASFAVGGGRGNNANYLIDGGSVQNLLLGVPTLTFDPPIESVQEFNLSISNYAAELGRSGGAVVQMTTKSGTNQFHGAVYEYFRNDDLQAKPYFAKTNPELRYNLFGASLGGPIKKDKTQFFVNYEGRRQTTNVTQTINVPTAAEITGDFSAFSTPVIDPNTGKQASYNGKANVLPPDELDPIGVRLAQFYPAPNVPGAAPNVANFRANDPTQGIYDVYVARIDHAFGSKDRLFGRFLAQTDHEPTASIYPTPGTDNFGVLAHNYYYNPSVTWYHNFTSTLINEFRFTYSRRQALSISAGANTNLASQIGIQGTNPSFFPTATLSGLAGFGNTTQQERLQTPINSNQYADNIAWQRSNHQFKAGVDLRTSNNTDNYFPTAGGSFAFTNTGISTNAAIGSLANLLLGRVSSATLQQPETLVTSMWSIGLFFQDDWRITPKLTLNLGIRYDLDAPRIEEHNRQNSFDVSTVNPVSGTPGIITFSGINGVSKYANDWDYRNIGPHVGFAWLPHKNTVVRGGGAILYPGSYDQATPIVAYTGFAKQISLSSPNSGKGTPAFLLKNNATDGTGQATIPTQAQLTPGYGAVAVGQKVIQAPQYFQRDRVTGYLYQGSFDIEQQLGGQFLLTLGYLGTFGHHLPAVNAENTNQVAPNQMALLPTTANTQTLRPFPQFGNVSIIAADQGQSNYNGLNVGLRKRYSSGFQFGVNYTWSKFIDNQVSRNELGNYNAGYAGTIDSFTDYYHPQDRRGLSGNDIRNRVIGSALYELPVGPGKWIHPNAWWVNELASGWTIGAITEVHSGTALGVLDSTNNTGTYSDGVRPNIIGNPNDLSGSRPRAQKVAQWFDPSAFAQNPAFTFGNAPRTFGRGPALSTTDASLLKGFKITEGTNLQFRAEALNVFNHANLANPNTLFGNGAFGQITSLQTGNQSRILQLALHLAF